METRLKKILLSFLGMGGQKLVQMFVSIITVPLIVGYLGSERFGLFLAVSNFGQWFIFDNGVAEGIKIKLISAFANKQKELVGQLITTGFFVLIIGSGILLISFLFVEPMVDWMSWFSADGLMTQKEISYAINALVYIMIINIPLRLLREIQTAEQKGYLFSVFMTFSSLIGLSGVLYVVYYDLGFSNILIAQYGSQTIALLLAFIWYFIKHKDLMPKLFFFNANLIRPLFQDGLYLLIFGVSRMAINGTDTFIINLGLGGEAAAKVSLIIRLFSYLEMFVSFIAYPSWPALADAIHRNDNNWVKNIIKKIIYGVIGFTFFGVVGVTLFCPFVINIWTNGNVVIEDNLLVAFLGVYMFFRIVSSAFGILLRSFGEIKNQSYLISIEAVLHVFLSYYLMIEFGIIGFAIGCLVSILLTRGLILPYRLFQKLYYFQ